MSLTRRNLLAGMGAAAAANAASSLIPARAWAAHTEAYKLGPVLLNSNENPYGPFPSVLAIADPFVGFNRYPDHRSEDVRTRLAQISKVSSDRVVTGCGSKIGRAHV